MARRSDADPGRTVRRDVLHNGDARAAYNRLMRDVFDLDSDRGDADFASDPTRRAFALFTPDGACVAGAETFRLPLMVDGAPLDAHAIRNVAVAPAWRGQGLFRVVMHDLLAWCDTQPTAPQMLYTAEPGLYERFGFRQAAQHKFTGTAPPARGSRAETRRLRLADPSDRVLTHRLLGERVPVSRHVALRGQPALVMAHLLDDPKLRLDYLDAGDALVVTRQTGTGIWQLVDVIGARIPLLADITGALGIARGQSLEVLFPPDRLAWRAAAREDDTGLMMRGPCPPAFAAPFMLPPTAEF